MATTLFSLLTVCGIDELPSHGGRGVTHVLSILAPDIAEPALERYPAHRRTVLRFDDVVEPAPGKRMPTRADVDAILAFGRALDDGTSPEGHLLVHCHAGISRSTAAMLLIMAQAEPDETEARLVERLAALRPQAWPNLAMIRHGDAALGRDGRLVRAVGGLYAGRLAGRPELAAALLNLGRGAELDLARAVAAAPPP